MPLMTDLGHFAGGELAFNVESEGDPAVGPPTGDAPGLPPELASVRMARAVDRSPEPSPGGGGAVEVGRRVLVVEDDRASRVALRRLFVARGWEVAEAATLAEGLASLEPPPRCVVLDLMLPDGNGLDLLRRIRSLGMRVRVVVATGASDARVEEIAGLGPDSLLRKPIDFPTLFKHCEG